MSRLAELQAMSYEDYVQTPEWNATCKKVLKVVTSCQECGSTYNLDVYHQAGWDRLGSEIEGDLIVLCDNCFKEMEHKEVPPVPLSLVHRLGIGAGAVAAVHITEMIIQAPLPFEIAGLIGGGLLAWHSPQLLGNLKAMAPKELGTWMEKQVERKHDPEKKYSWWELAMGRHEQAPLAPVPGPMPLLPPTRPIIVDETPVFPAYRTDETLRIGQTIDKKALSKLAEAAQMHMRVEVEGRRFEPHVNALLGKGMILAAVQGSGKSMLSGLVIEQCGECDAPAIVLDHKGEYVPIAELSHLSGIIAGGPYAQKIAVKKNIPYFALTTENAEVFVERVITEHLQAVVILPSYGDTWVARAEIVAEVGQALMRYSARMRQEEQKILPCLVLLDEAQLYIPQNKDLLPPEAKENIAVLNNLSNAFFALVSNGRSNGYTMCFATQSLTYIAKWAIKSSQIRVIMRHVEYNDLNTCEEILGKKDTAVATREEIESMPAGVGIVFGFTPKPMIVQFDRRQSRDESETPGIERLRKPAVVEATVGTEPLKIGDLSIAQLQAILGRSDIYGAATAFTVSPNAQNTPVFEREAVPIGESRESVKSPVKPRESGENVVKSHQENQEGESVSPEDEQAVIRVAFALQQANGKVTREDIKNSLQLNNKKHWIVKAVCDKYGIAMPGGK